jgi:hypothetical protein
MTDDRFPGGALPETPDEEQVEAARLLAADAREQLLSEGYSDGQILDWAQRYVAGGNPAADVHDFVAWVLRGVS